MKLVYVESNNGIPKYRQIIASLEKAIDSGALPRDAKLPSVNKICLAYGLSRDTVLLAYDELKKRGIVYAIPGKGYYVRSVGVGVRQKIFLVFDELNSFKEDIYNAFLNNIGPDAQVDIFFHHFNEQVFSKLIADGNGNYTKYVIMPTDLRNAAAEIAALPENEVYILDQTNEQLSAYPAVYQNFVSDISKALAKGQKRLAKYSRLILIFPGFREPAGMRQGFLKFCGQAGFEHEVIPAFGQRKIRPGEVYIIPNDRDLVSVIETARKQRLKPGREFGIISYNETPLKKVVENGITTISTDFSAMGRLMAEMVVSGKNLKIENKCRLIIRKSL